jgi:hypothetical protein
MKAVIRKCGSGGVCLEASCSCSCDGHGSADEQTGRAERCRLSFAPVSLPVELGGVAE